MATEVAEVNAGPVLLPQHDELNTKYEHNADITTQPVGEPDSDEKQGETAHEKRRKTAVIC